MHKTFKKNRLPISLFITLILLILLTYQIILSDKFSIFTFIGDTNISLLTQRQAIQAYEGKFNQRLTTKLEFSTTENSFTIDLATSEAKIDYSTLVQEFSNQHPTDLLTKFKKQIRNIFLPTRFNPKITISVNTQLDTISESVNQPALDAQLMFDETEITTKEGIYGIQLDKEELKNQIISFLQQGQYNPNLPLKKVQPKLTTEHVNKAKSALDTINQEPIKLHFKEKVWTIDVKQLLILLDLKKGEKLLDEDQTKSFIKTIAFEIDAPVQEGLFEFNTNTKRVTAFKQSQSGQTLDIDKTFDLILGVLINNSTKSIELPVNIINPKIQSGDINSLGIKELLGQGVSHFAGSIPNRIYNVNLTASKINGILLPPGEVFSFNRTVGDISGATGFKQAYVIKEGRTVLDDGGGVCQDSTTLFRAVLNAGLPVIKRTAHAYRVGYYEQGFPPGLDATIFYPSVDFQFKNDTEHHILVQAHTEGLTLYVDLYGTSDGRITNLSTPVVTNRMQAPPELRQDDPTLPKGTVKQVDWAAQGATVTFTRNITRNSQVIHNEVWKSVYKPWQAVYLVGTKD